MKIAICGSLSFAKEMGDLKEELKNFGHKAVVPYSARQILIGEYSGNKIERSKKDGTFFRLVVKNDAIRRWYKVIKSRDAILVANFEKNGVKNYIGGNAFLEMGFAHILRKKIFILNSIPEISYKDEILAIQPKILLGKLKKIK